MFNPEQLPGNSSSDVNPSGVSRRDVLKMLGGLAVGAILPSAGWIYSGNMPWEDKEWFPDSEEAARKFGLHTLYEPGGPLDYYDSLSYLVGEQTNLRQKAQDFAAWNLEVSSYLNPVLLDTLGNCDFLGKAIAYGEPEPVGTVKVPRWIKVGLLVAKHSVDNEYRLTTDQSLLDAFSNGKNVVVEYKDASGFWTLTAYGYNVGRRMLIATGLGRGSREVPIDTLRNAFIPVPPGEEVNFPPRSVVPSESSEFLERRMLNTNGRLVDYLVYNQPL